jgi:uncharacterized protein (TIRG00374 family)
MIGGACAGIVFVLLRPDLVLKIWSYSTRWLSESLQRRGSSLLSNAIHALSSLKSPTSLVVLFVYSLMQWGMMAVMIWLALWAFGVSIPVSVAFIALAVVMIAVTVPSAPGYIGAIQAAFVFALVPFGVSQEAAFAASVFFLVVQWVPVTLTGVAFFLSSGLKLTQVRRDIDEAENTLT